MKLKEGDRGPVLDLLRAARYRLETGQSKQGYHAVRSVFWDSNTDVRPKHCEWVCRYMYRLLKGQPTLEHWIYHHSALLVPWDQLHTDPDKLRATYLAWFDDMIKTLEESQ